MSSGYKIPKKPGTIISGTSQRGGIPKIESKKEEKESKDSQEITSKPVVAPFKSPAQIKEEEKQKEINRLLSTVPENIYSIEIDQPPENIENINLNLFSRAAIFKGKCFDEANQKLFTNPGNQPILKFMDNIYLYQTSDNSFFCLSLPELKSLKKYNYIKDQLPGYDDQNDEKINLSLRKPVTSDEPFFSKQVCIGEQLYPHITLATDEIVDFFNKFFGYNSERDKKIRSDYIPLKFPIDLENLDIYDLIYLVLLMTEDKTRLKETIQRRINVKYACLSHQKWVKINTPGTTSYTWGVRERDGKSAEPDRAHTEAIKRLQIILDLIQEFGNISKNLIYPLSRLYLYQKFIENFGETNIIKYNWNLFYCRYGEYILTDSDIKILKEFFKDFDNTFTYQPILKKVIEKIQNYRLIGNDEQFSINLVNVPSKDDIRNLRNNCRDKNGIDFPPTFYFPYGYTKFPYLPEKFIIYTDKIGNGFVLDNLYIPETGINFLDFVQYPGYRQYSNHREYPPTLDHPYGLVATDDGRYIIFKDSNRNYFEKRGDLKPLREYLKEESEEKEKYDFPFGYEKLKNDRFRIYRSRRRDDYFEESSLIPLNQLERILRRTESPKRYYKRNNSRSRSRRG